MRILAKAADKDYTVLNLTDIHWDIVAWMPGNEEYETVVGTIRELIARVQPDLITISGDLSWGMAIESYVAVADLMDSFNIPWAPVWGNHDYEKATVNKGAVEEFAKRPLCLFEAGDPDLGCGNYTLAIQENGRTVAGLIMADTHKNATFMDENGIETGTWGRLYPNQLDWIRQQGKLLGTASALIQHIPIFGYQEAFRAAFREGLDPKAVTLEESQNGSCWNSGYETALGVQHEGICSYPLEEGALNACLDAGVKAIIVGHDHNNNWIIRHKGIRFVFSLKTGPGCYWKPFLNGGTVIKITSQGIGDIYHEYVVR